MDLAAMLLGANGSGGAAPLSSASSSSGVSFGAGGNAVSGQGLMLPWIVAGGCALLFVITLFIRR